MRRLFFRAAAVVVASGIAAPGAHAVCRVVEPSADSGTDPVTFDPTTAAIFVMAPDQLVDYRCPERPAGERPVASGDFSEVRIAPRLPGLGPRVPSGAPLVAREHDPSVCWDGSDAEPVRGPLVHVVIRPAIYANGGSAGLIMPIPRRADVHVAPDGLFDAVAAQERRQVEETVQYTEDPSLGWQCGDPHYAALEPSVVDDALGAPMMLMGCGAEDDYYRPGLDGYDVEVVDSGDGTVNLERIPTTEDYDVAMVNASSIDALLAWLDDNGFRHDPIDDNAFAAYVGEDAWFMTVKVTPRDMGGARVALAPLIATWRGETVPVMNELQYQPGGGMLITDAFVLAPTRMASADAEGETLYAAPAEPGSDPMLAGFGLEHGWLTRLQLVRRTSIPRDDSFIAPARFEEVVRPTIERTLSVRIAAACCPGNARPGDEGAHRTFTETRSYLEGQRPDDDSLFYRAPPPEAAYCSARRGYGGRAYYACAVDDRRSAHRLAALGSWFPLLLVLGSIITRRRRR